MSPSLVEEELQVRELPRHAEPKVVPSSSWVSLAIATALMLFSYGVWNISLAAWLAPVFMLRFVRLQRARVGLPVAYVVLIATFVFQLRGMVPIPGVGYYIFLVVWGIPLVLPYLIDRLIVNKLVGLSACLVFPSAWAATEYLASQGPFASWGLVAYSQYGDLPLLQVLSVTGLWGITFLIGWFASTCNWLWEEGLDSKRASRGVWMCAATICIVLLAGGARMALFPPYSQTVRVASISKTKVDPEPTDAAWGRLLADRAATEDIDAIRRWSTAVDNDFLARAEREMQSGAKIVFWGEGNAPVFKEDEAALIAQGSAIAAKHQAYLGMALAVWNRGKALPLENKLVLVEPGGRVAWEYNKVHPVPGPDAAVQVLGDGKLRAIDTPYGRVSSIICFDGDFPQLLAQAGALRSDVMLDPSNDWRAIDPWHTQMASFRAIEQGVNLIRQTSQGLSAAFDYQGRRLAAMDHYQTTDYTMISQVPTRGVRTIYSRLGDWFAWYAWRAWFR